MNPVVRQFQNYIGQYITTAPSPVSNWLKGKIIAVEENTISVEFEVREEMTNPVKMLHGGMVAAIIDDMIGMTLFVSGLKTFYATVSLHIDYMANVRVGAKVRATTNILKKGNRVIHAECTLWSTEETLLAKGSSSLVSIENPR